MTNPIAVVIAAYNAEATLLESLNSITNGTTPATIFIIDDASKIPVTTLLENIKPQPDFPLHILRNPTNLGPAATRNRGFNAAMESGHTFIAVQDADDLSHPHRLAKQSAYLIANPHLAALGTWANAVEEHTLKTLYISHVPANPAAVHNALWLDCCFVTPSLMFRTSALQKVGVYNPALRNCEDYELLFRLAKKYPMANLPETLLDLRLCASGISLSTLGRQRRMRLKVQLMHFQPFMWQSWAGIIKSLIRLCVPTSLVNWRKKFASRSKSVTN